MNPLDGNVIEKLREQHCFAIRRNLKVKLDDDGTRDHKRNQDR